MPALRFSGPVLPDGESRDLYVVDGTVTYEPQPGAETVARGWIVPGLVDAHNHLGLEDHGAVDDSEVEAQALADRDAGALLLRDCGSPADTRWVHERADLPRLVRAGRHVARTKRYIRSYAHEVEPADLATYVAREARGSDGWVKVVGDWISRETGDLAPSFPADAFAEAIAAAHAEGAKVTAHCFGRDVLQGLLDAGIDCIEHGTGLSLDQLDQMAAGGVALVPTVMQTAKFPTFVEQGRERFPDYAATMEDLYARRREVLMSAHEAGVALYVGSDGGGAQRHGWLAGEALAMAELGLPPADVLAAASWRGREWLGFPGLEEGASADLVVYDRDPATDLTALWEPVCVVLRGAVVGRSAG
ncbi:amidohydrolase family protein [Nocardioides sp. zg-579]|uniref:Amidohydrolase family protein n=1 Tax=Nocardioides marmotae TaxID=2663857 RepID=A0A6I3JBJ6_9ACTN|nr:amidohydrolase family protein [Nocardioides marmotae]MCR6031784.1 amidohydrolase family protein [Gordonia jinghuaiqii]MTB95423.1 amidohydrolase family protein [Nocardioides marmotae]QKE00863.1 amidohydrolase family protein [Nocardioides marmotae]